MEREILGYELVKKEYEIPAAIICGIMNGRLNLGKKVDVDILENSTDRIKLKNAGVLDIWFKPVLKTLEVIKYSIMDITDCEFSEVFDTKEQAINENDEKEVNGNWHVVKLVITN